MLMNFLCIYLDEGSGVMQLCMYKIVWEHIVSLTTEPLNGCLRNFVGMKYSWSLTSVVVFRQDPSRGGSRVGQK